MTTSVVGVEKIGASFFIQFIFLRGDLEKIGEFVRIEGAEIDRDIRASQKTEVDSKY